MCDRCVKRPGRLLGAGRTGLGAGSAAIALLVPKCPLCVAAWAWAFSVLGVSFDKWNLIKWPLTAGFLLLAALLLGAKAKPWVKTAILFGAGVCLSFKVAQDSSSLGLALGVGLSAVVAIGLRILANTRGQGHSFRRTIA
ncbi:MAG TPA: hypothetical protein VKT78_00290 [Fimbriimonadaceae bacterium]|nr:hypothetical protein [Fimbriimonadaceae bacterium]